MYDIDWEKWLMRAAAIAPWLAAAFIIATVINITCDPDPLPAQYYPPTDIGLIDDSTMHGPLIEYKLIDDSLFVSNPYDLNRAEARAWRFVGIVTFADTTIVRYESENIERYWR